MRFGSSIRAQLITGITVTTLAGIGLIGLFSIKIVETNALDGKLREARVMVDFVRAAVHRVRMPEDRTRASEILTRAFRSVGIGDFLIKDRQGWVLAARGSLPEGGDGEDAGGRTVFQEHGMRVVKFGGGFFDGPGRYFYVSASSDPVDGGSGDIRFTMSLADVREDVAGIKRFLILYALGDSVIIIVLGIYMLSRGIIGPIKRLEVAATRIAGGSLGERVEEVPDNEIGSLALSFNRMAGRLEEEIKRLARINRELTSTQEKLLRSTTLAAVGRLAAGFAHEIGNPLGAVSGYVSVLLKGAGEGGGEEEILKRMEREVERINSMVRDFLELARPSMRPFEAVDIKGIIKETLSTLKMHESFKDVSTGAVFADGLPRVRMDGEKLRQVLMNLLINAAEVLDEARPERKEITVETGVTERTDDRTRRGRRRKDDPVFPGSETKSRYVYIAVQDTGPGMNEDELRRIFEPFYTTKGPGKGTGLGLFVSQSIIRAYGGEIEVSSRPGEGSRFTVLLPEG